MADPYTRYVIFDAYGRIIQGGSGPASSVPLIRGTNRSLIVDRVFSPEELAGLYVLDGALAARAPMPGVEAEYEAPADGITMLSIAVPAGTTITAWHDGSTHENEASLDFVSAVAGSYRFDVLPPPQFREQRVTIHAV